MHKRARSPDSSELRLGEDYNYYHCLSYRVAPVCFLVSAVGLADSRCSVHQLLTRADQSDKQATISDMVIFRYQKCTHAVADVYLRADQVKVFTGVQRHCCVRMVSRSVFMRTSLTRRRKFSLLW